MLNNEPQIQAAQTVEGLARLVQYHPESIRRCIRQGRIRALPFGGGYRIPAAEVARILSEGLPYRAPEQKTNIRRPSTP